MCPCVCVSEREREDNERVCERQGSMPTKLSYSSNGGRKKSLMKVSLGLSVFLGLAAADLDDGSF